MFLFCLRDPALPALVGTLDLSPRLQGAVFQYDDLWLRSGFSLSPDLPLRRGEFFPEPGHLPGAIDDARPDRWGERVIRQIDAPRRLSVLEYLFFAGDERFGALGVSLVPDSYQPSARGPEPHLGEVHALYDVVRAIELGQVVDESLHRLIRPGATLGGAKPKALVDIGGHTHIVKFPERGDTFDAGLVEHATMTLAHRAGLDPAPTRPIALGANHGHAIAVRRFDREVRDGGPARRLHAMSLRSALRATGSAYSYPEFALHLRRYAPVQEAPAMECTVFRRMVFNILIDNTDDHEQNHALVFVDPARPRLAPAFDMLPTCQNLGYQQIGVGAQGAVSSLENALGAHKAFRLTHRQATDEICAVAQVVDGWRRHFEQVGVSASDIERIAGSIDRPFLRDQRQWALRQRP